MTVSIPQLLAFHADKGTPDDYCPSVNLGELKALVRSHAILSDAAMRHIAEHRAGCQFCRDDPIVNPGDPDPPLPEDYPVRQERVMRSPAEILAEFPGIDPDTTYSGISAIRTREQSRRAPPGWQFGFIDEKMLDKFRLQDRAHEKARAYFAPLSNDAPALTTSRTPAGILPPGTPILVDDNAEPLVRSVLGLFALVILFALLLRIVTGTP